MSRSLLISMKITPGDCHVVDNNILIDCGWLHFDEMQPEGYQSRGKESFAHGSASILSDHQGSIITGDTENRFSKSTASSLKPERRIWHTIWTSLVFSPKSDSILGSAGGHSSHFLSQSP